MFYVKFDKNGYISEFVEKETENYIAVPNLNCRLVNGNIVDETNKILKLEEKQKRIAELKQKLAETDYVCLKFVDGELTQAEYAETWQKRKQWREEINKLEKEI